MSGISFLVVLLCLPVSLQSQVRRYSRSVEWEASRQRPVYHDSVIVFSPDVRYLSFRGADYPDYEMYFPWYHELISLDASSVVDSIRLDDIIYGVLSPEELYGIQGLENLSEEVDFSTMTIYQQRKPFLRVSILPLRRNPATGEVEKMTSFTIKTYEKLKASMAEKSLPYAVSSVLATGKWYKIKIQKDGIYKLTYEDLEKTGLVNPGNIRVYGNGGRALPVRNANRRPDDLQENAIYMESGSDGIFNKGDYILFYGKGVVSWQYDTVNDFFAQVINEYSDAAYYFLTTDLGPGKKIQSMPQASGVVTHTVNSFDDYDCYEKNLVNIIKSGRQWFSFRFSGSFDTTFVFPNIDAGESARMKVNVASRSATDKLFTIYGNDQSLGTVYVDNVILKNFTGIQAKQNSGYFNLSPASDNIKFSVVYNKTEYSDIGWLDYVTLNVRRKLVMTDKAMFFRDVSSVGAGHIARFDITGATGKLGVWDVSDPCNVARIESSLNGNVLSYTAAADSLREFVALVYDGAFPKPVTEGDDLGLVENQNLHGAAVPEMLIVTHPLFLAQAEDLAEFHRTKDNLNVMVVTTEQVYNEFSSGAPDLSAIRDFARMLYLKDEGSGQQFKYMLLFGDGSYHNHAKTEGNPNFILTCQSEESLDVARSYVTDDFYGMLDENEGGLDNISSGLLDLGLGRLPVTNTDEAVGIIEKIKGYNRADNMKDWRNKIIFVADDQNGNSHMTQANSLADSLRKNHPHFVVKKVLSDAYEQVSTSTGARYPEVNKAIYNNVHKGVLIFNYTGHGNEKGLAEEQLVTREQLSAYTNADNLPLFITATCEFSRFDDLAIDEESKTIREQKSAGETALLNPNGGAIALLTTTRLVYGDQNTKLNSYFYQFAFEHDSTGKYYRMGDVIRLTKNAYVNNQNKLNFILLGDPALRLAIPDYSIVTDSLNGKHVTESLDTLKAFTEITIKGHVVDNENNKLTGFNGVIYPSVYDKVQIVSTRGNDDIEYTMDFEVRDNLIYKGKANVNNGEFSFSFIVPKDITYSLGSGKICYYAQDSVDDASGYFSQFIVGGTSSSVVMDATGPLIDLYINDENFVSGGITNKDPQIYARIFDENGINTSGNGIGHDIVGIFDDDATQPLVLNDFYEAELNDYSHGILRYPLSDLEVGRHTLKIRVWDVFNNPGEAYIEFEVIDKEDLVLENVYNYPNPARDFTYFQFEHNKAGSTLKITIDIFDLSGRRIRTLEQNLYMEGYHSSPLEWDLKDQNGNLIRNGIYPYRIRVEDETGLLSDGFQKLLILK
ncbi:MAG: type IX secretion system sortase PorU [Bacteroidales bacterium]|nr:type IX secretion system sortase PorU [Bacteroidales bacterium]